MSRKRLTALIFLAGALILGVALAFSGIDSSFAFNWLADNHYRLSRWVGENRGWAAILFVAIYFVSAAFSVPIGVILTLAAGLLFGTVLGGILSLIGATIGSLAVFFFAQTAFGEPLRARAGPAFRRIEAGFRAHALSYLILLRLVPLFPYWLVNLVPALVNMSPLTYTAGTFLGMIPGALVFSSLGNGLDSIFHACEIARMSNPAARCDPPPMADVLLVPELLWPLAGLCLLALVPVVLRRYLWRGELIAPAPGGPSD